MSEIQQHKLLYLIKRIADTGKISDKTKFRNEGNAIFTFKPKPDRFLCFFQEGKKIIITNGFVKKQDKLPKKEKEKALTLKKKYLERVTEGKYYES